MTAQTPFADARKEYLKSIRDLSWPEFQEEARRVKLAFLKAHLRQHNTVSGCATAIDAHRTWLARIIGEYGSNTAGFYTKSNTRKKPETKYDWKKGWSKEQHQDYKTFRDHGYTVEEARAKVERPRPKIRALPK